MANRTITLTPITIGESITTVDIYHTSTDSGNLIVENVTRNELLAGYSFVDDDSHNQYYIVSDSPCQTETIVSITTPTPTPTSTPTPTPTTTPTEEDPYTPIDGTARFIATNNSGDIKLYDTSFSTVTPTNPFATLPNSNYNLGGVSDNLTYMVAVGKRFSEQDIKISDDGGQTFSNPSSGTFLTSWEYTKSSKSGQVILSLIKNTTTPPTSDHNFMLSTDYGNNFSKITFSDFVGISDLRNVKLSYGGKFIAIGVRGYNGSSYTQYYYLSKDYGATWNSIGTNGTDYNILISGNGQYIIFIPINNPGNSLYSSDYGENFSIKNYSSLTNLQYYHRSIGSAMSETGKYYILSSPLGISYVSYGDNFAASLPQNTRSTSPGGSGTKNVRTSNSGETIFWSDEGSSSPDYSFSDDFGATWSTQKSAPNSVGQGPIYLIDVS